MALHIATEAMRLTTTVTMAEQGDHGKARWRPWQSSATMAEHKGDHGRARRRPWQSTTTMSEHDDEDSEIVWKVDDSEVIEFLLHTEIIHLCPRITDMDTGLWRRRRRRHGHGAATTTAAWSWGCSGDNDDGDMDTELRRRRRRRRHGHGAAPATRTTSTWGCSDNAGIDMGLS